MPLNIPLLKAAQATILDPANDFDMSDWNCCIAGHIMQAAHESYFWATRAGTFGREPVEVASAVAGFSKEIGVGLFSQRCDRAQAAASLQRLIDDEQTRIQLAKEAAAMWDELGRTSALERRISALEPEQSQPCSSALEPSASSASARAESPIEQDDLVPV